MRRRLTALPGILLCALLAGGCAEEPFVSVSTPSFQPPDGITVVSLCYNAHATTREELSALAQKECDRTEERTMVELWHHDRMLNECPVLAKMRVSYLCRPLRR